MFDATTLVTSSDFGRTLTSNGKGTDHGWAGNYVVLGLNWAFFGNILLVS